MTSEFLSVVVCVIVDWYYYFMQNLFISVISHVPNFYLSDSFLCCYVQTDEFCASTILVFFPIPEIN